VPFLQRSGTDSKTNKPSRSWEKYSTSAISERRCNTLKKDFHMNLATVTEPCARDRILLATQWIYRRQANACGPLPSTRMKDYPLYLKSAITLLGLVLLSYILFTLADISIPLAFAVLIAILLNPLNNQLKQWRVPPVVAMFLTILFALLIFSGIGYFFVQQLAGFANELPQLKTKSTEIVHELQTG
jgi:hypothetical protein